MKLPASLLSLTAVFLLLTSCQELNDDRIPLFAVNIDLSNQGLWTSYGVANYGQYNYFILEDRLPPGFNYIYNSATGYGGILLINGFDPVLGDQGPLAYDMSCPVERQRNIRVWIVPDSETYEVECQECHSRYNVVEGIGAPLSEPALSLKYGLRKYRCLPTINGGYFITQ